MQNDIFHNPVVVGILVGIPSFLLGYLGYRRSKEADKATEKAGAVEQVINGLNNLANNLQEDNKDLRQQIMDLRTNLMEVTAERDDLKKQVKTLTREYGNAT